VWGIYDDREIGPGHGKVLAAPADRGRLFIEDGSNDRPDVIFPLLVLDLRMAVSSFDQTPVLSELY
jgi:hypothetical protein